MGNSARTPYPYPYLSSDEFGCTAGLEPATSSCQAGALLSSFFFFRVWCGGDRTRDLVSRLAKLLLALSDEKSSANRRSANMCSKIAVCMTSVFVLVVRCASSLHVHVLSKQELMIKYTTLHPSRSFNNQTPALPTVFGQGSAPHPLRQCL